MHLINFIPEYILNALRDCKKEVNEIEVVPVAFLGGLSERYIRKNFGILSNGNTVVVSSDEDDMILCHAGLIIN